MRLRLTFRLGLGRANLPDALARLTHFCAAQRLAR
jgi:hypothetical protein